MQLKPLPYAFSICQVADFSAVDWHSPYCFLAKTVEENSLVCLTEAVPANATAREDGWRAFQITGVLAFSLVGVLAKISSLLAEARIPIFAVSTYNTDYILVKSHQFAAAEETLAIAGYHIA